MLEAMHYDRLDCYLLLRLAWEKQARGAASLMEPGKSRAESAVLAEMGHAARSGWMSGFGRSVSPSASFARTD